MGHDGDMSDPRSECGNVTTIQQPADPGYVIRTNSLKGRMKAFINVCKSETISEPSFTNQNGNRDVLWNVPHGLGCAKDEQAKRGERVKVFDFIIHPNAFRMTELNTTLKKVIDDMAVEGVTKHFSVRLDRKSLTFPEMTYKGTAGSVGYVEKVTTIAIDRKTNGLKELCANQCCEKETDRNGSHCQADCTGAKECVKQENQWIDDSSGKNVTDLSNDVFMNMANGDHAVKVIDKRLVSADETVADILPDYKSQQDEATLTFIFAVERVKKENVVLSVVSPQEICLKMMTVSEKGAPLCYTCYLKFPSKCRLMENGCRVDVSEVNVVLKVAKAGNSRKTWNTYFVGTSPQHLEVRDFVTVDNLRRELDSLDLNCNSAVNDRPKTTENVNVVTVNDEKLVLEIKKAEETEQDDVPGEIIVIHERGIPRLHGILKQRSMSESSDDWSMWSCSTDRRTSTATGSETESDEDESSQDLFRPRIKKSVSFNEHIDQTMFVINQSVSQMHVSLKNKRRRIRKREQKLDVKEARRRQRSNSDSCSHGERDFDYRPLEDRILASMVKMKSVVDKPEDMHVADKPEDMHAADKSEDTHVVDKSEETYAVDKPEDMHAVDKPEDVHAADKPGDVHAADKSEDVHAADKPEDLYAVDKPEDMHAADKSEDVHAADKPEDVHAADKPEDVHAADKSEDVHAADKPEDVHAADKSEDVHAADKSEDVHAADKPEDVHAADKSEDVHAADKSEDVHAADKPEDVHAADKSEDVHAADKPEDVHAADKPEDVHAADKSEDVHAADKPEDVHAADKSEDVHAADKSEDVHAADKSEDVHAADKSEDVHAADKSEDMNATAAECNGRIATLSRSDDATENNQEEGNADEEKMIYGDVEGTRRSKLDLFHDITNLETCGGTANGEGHCNFSGDNLIAEVDGDFMDIKCPIARESHLYKPVERTCNCGDLSELKLTVQHEENLSSERTFNTSDCSFLKQKSNEYVSVSSDLFNGHIASIVSVTCPQEKVKDSSVLEYGKNSDSDNLQEEEDGAGTLSMLM